ncbi:unnamed protein product, partial [Iphiclides podalirius]
MCVYKWDISYKWDATHAGRLAAHGDWLIDQSNDLEIYNWSWRRSPERSGHRRAIRPPNTAVPAAWCYIERTHHYRRPNKHRRANKTSSQREKLQRKFRRDASATEIDDTGRTTASGAS